MRYCGKSAKEKVPLFQTGALMSAAICAAVYVWCLSDPLEGNKYALTISNSVQVVYTIKVIYLAFIGILCIFINKKGRGEHRNYVCLAAIAGIACYCILLYAMGYRNASGIKELLLSLWPLIVYISADRCIRLISSRTWALYLTGMALYYAALCVSIWLIEYKMAGNGFTRREPVETSYLFITGIFAWRIAKKHIVNSDQEWKTAVSWIFPLAGFAAVFWNHERLLQIFSGLTNPVTAIYADNPLKVNWIGYRLTLFLDAWAGDFSFIEDNWISMNLYSSPLFWIRYMKGWGAFFIVLALELFLLYCIVSIILRRNAGENPLVRILLTTVIIRSLLGLFVDLFVITTPDIGMLLLRNPADILLILYLVFGEFEVRRECMNEGDRKRIKKNSKSGRASVPPRRKENSSTLEGKAGGENTR